MIEPNKNQPRTTFNEEDLNQLSESIKEHGIIQPITVKKLSNGRYQIISGERRYRASKLSCIKSIPAYIKEKSDSSILEMALVENIQREDLNPIEMSLAFEKLILECNLTQEQCSKKNWKKEIYHLKLSQTIKITV